MKQYLLLCFLMFSGASALFAQASPTCADPIIIAPSSLPFSTTDNTFNYGDSFDGLPGDAATCGTSDRYLDGDIVFYSFTPEVTGDYRFSISSLTNGYSGMFLYQGCGNFNLTCEGGVANPGTADRVLDLTLTSGSEYILVISTFSDFEQSIGYQLNIKSLLPGGTTCADPIVVPSASLPFSDTDKTSNYGDDVNGAPGNLTTCGTSGAYLDGDDVFYSFTPSTSGAYRMTLSNLSGNNAAMFLYADCADVGSSCLEGAINGTSTADLFFNVSLTANEDYLLAISSFGFFQQSVGYTVTIEAIPPGEVCASPIVIEPFSTSFTTNDNTANYGDDISGSPGNTGCGNTSRYLDGDDVFYSFTPSVSDDYTFTLSNLSAGYSGMFLYSNCTAVGSGCLEGIANTTSDDRIFEIALTAGEEYVLVISSWGSFQQSVGYTLTVSSTIGQTCSNPIIIPPASLPFTTTDNTSNYGDDVDGAPGSSATCGTDGGYLGGDDVFYSFTPATSDRYTFTLSGLTNGSSGMFLYADCGDVGTVCLAGEGSGSTDDRVFTVSLTAGEDYLVAISTFDFAGRDNVGYTLGIEVSTVGNTCANPIIVDPAALPYVTTDNTSNYGDDNDGAPGSSATCGTSNPYLNGDDVFYRFTPSVSDLYIITLSNLVSSGGTFAGAMFLYADCASVGSVCLEGDADNLSPERKFTLPLVAGEDYVIAISTFPNPQSIRYTLTIETEPPGSNCDDPLIVDPAALPFTTTDNTSNYGDGVGGVPGSEAGCGTASQYLGGNEVFYSFTPATSDNYTLTLSNLSNGSSGIFLYADCTDVGMNCLEGVANFSSQERVISVSLTAGEAYLIVISTFAASSPQTVGYTLNIQLTPPGVTCSRPIVVGALPFTTTDNTSNYADNVDGVPGSLATCGTSGIYLSGDDVFYAFTPPTTDLYLFDLTGASIASGMFLYADCADVGSVCLEGVATNSTTERSFAATLEGGQTYLLVISTLANSAQTTDYTLNIRAAIAGSTCANPLLVGSLPFVTTDNISRYGDYVAGGSSGGSCNTSGAYLRGDEVFYRFTPAVTEAYKFTLSNLSSNGSGIFLYADCGDVGMACLGSVGNTGAADRFFKATLTAGEDYYLVISSDGVFTGQQSVGYTLTVAVVPPGEVCANPIVIPTLPYTTTDNTGNYGNDVDGVAGEFEACGAFGSYLRGDDVFYRFTADRSTTYEFTLSGLSTSYSGIFLYSDCGDVGMNCIAGAGDDNASTRNFTAFLTAGEEYLIAISKDPNGPADQSVGYTLTVDYAPPGNICQDPIFVDPNALPYTTTDNTSNYGDDVDSRLGTATCGNTLGFISGDDVFYSFTPATSGLYRITLSGLNTDGSSIFVFADCADVGSVCVESFADYTTADRVFNTSLTAGTGYIVLVSSRPPTQSIDYTLTIEDAPPGINCNDPIVVDPAALPFTTTDNTGKYGDFVDGIPGSEATCMVRNDNDHLSGDEVFYSFTPAVSDDYTFTLSNLNQSFSGMFLYADCADIGTECLEGAGNNLSDDRVIITSLTAGVPYVLVISTVGGVTQNIDYTLSLDFTAPGNVCSSPIVIAPLSLPFTVTDNTSNYSNNLSGSPGTSCGSTSRYLDGNNAFYSFTPSISEDYTFTLSNLSDIGAGMFLYADCASVGTECLAGAATGRDRLDRGFTTSLTAGEAYILQISTWAPPQTTTYTLNVSGETVLPVTLTSFTGQATGKTNKLSWTTDREEAADRFILERTSTQTGNWQALGELTAAGNSQTEVSYELIDAQPAPVAFYRLKMLDLDGSFTYSDIVRLENDAVASDQLSVFPVPTTNSLTVSFTAKVSGTANIELTDLNGRTISRQKVDVGAGIITERMDLSSVPSGVYLIRVVLGDRQLLKRVVRQ